MNVLEHTYSDSEELIPQNVSHCSNANENVKHVFFYSRFGKNETTKQTSQ